MISSPSTKPKFCKDCKHSIPDRSGWWFCLFLPLLPYMAWLAYCGQYRYAKCRVTAAPNLDNGHRYTGEPYREKPDYLYCATSRSSRCDDGRCGPEGKLFELRK